LAAQNGVCRHFKNSQPIDFGLITSKLQAIFAERVEEKTGRPLCFSFSVLLLLSPSSEWREKKEKRETPSTL
jgi:hypothetical protein